MQGTRWVNLPILLSVQFELYKLFDLASLQRLILFLKDFKAERNSLYLTLLLAVRYFDSVKSWDGLTQNSGKLSENVPEWSKHWFALLFIIYFLGCLECTVSIFLQGFFWSLNVHGYCMVIQCFSLYLPSQSVCIFLGSFFLYYWWVGTLWHNIVSLQVVSSLFLLCLLS